MKKRYSLAILIPFVIFTIYVIYIAGYSTVGIDSFSKITTTQVFVDLSLSILLINIWIIKQIIDYKMNKGLILFYPILSTLLGVIGPLIFLIHLDLFKSKKF